MKDLERMLVELGRTLREPEPPPATQRAAEQLRRDRLRPGHPRARAGLAVALAAASVAAVAAVPAARTAIANLFNFGGVSIERVDQLPPVSPRSEVAPGKELELATARARVSFGVLVPARDPKPSHVFLYAADPPGGQLTLIYGALQRPRLVITEFIGDQARGVFNKKTGRLTTVERVSIGGQPGIWLSGAKHAFSFVDGAGTTRTYETRLAAHTLIWQQGRLTLRLEGDLSRSEALRLARSFEPAR